MEPAPELTLPSARAGRPAPGTQGADRTRRPGAGRPSGGRRRAGRPPAHRPRPGRARRGADARRTAPQQGGQANFKYGAIG
ncbi:hypothetical protein AB0Q96_35270, partial [Streptomyces sp. NPDC093111]